MSFSRINLSKNRFVKPVWYVLLTFLSATAFGQEVNMQGVVLDGEAEALPLATVLLLPDSALTTTDSAGKFGLRTTVGYKEIVVSYTGFETLRHRGVMSSDTFLTLALKTKVAELNELTVNATRYSSEDMVQSTRTGTTTLTQKDLNAIPVLGGEADLIKTLQLLPGTVRGVEGSSDLFVRGGAADQNLVLLDGAPIYNTSHLFGFLSVFNPSILDHVEAINGGFPAAYGGRLSSILNITSNADVARRTAVSGDVGLIASRLYVEHPLVKDKASFWIAGRRTYIDKVLQATGEDLPYFFYDFNGKVILQPSSRNRIEFSTYTGEDVLDIFRDRNNDGNGFFTSYQSGNNTQSLRWDHSFPSDWRSSLSLSRSAYQYNISNTFEENQLRALSDIEDYTTRLLFEKDSIGGSGSLQFGVTWIRHALSPSVVNTAGTIAQLLESSATEGRLAHELALYVQHEFSLSPRVRVNAGFRTSSGLTDNRNYLVPEPRLALRYALSKSHALKLSYSRMAQYMHRISNSAVTTPADVWYTVTDEIAPQTAHQVAVAWQHFRADEKIFLSAETYYKDMRNLIGYEEGTNLFFNADFESSLVQGTGRAYGFEVLARKEAGKFTGWISYTLSWSQRHFAALNNGNWFPARYDRRHNGALVMQYALGKRWAASLVWEFISGARFTPVIGQYIVVAPTLTGVDLIPVYSDINAVKLADTHRLDAGIKFMGKSGKKFQWQWFAGVYNVYNRASPVGMMIEQNEADGSLRYLQPGLFGLLPFISYGFRF